MQRRANIRNPTLNPQESHSPGMLASNRSGASRAKKALHQSLTPRITILLLIVFCVLVFTRLTLFPSDPSSPSYHSPRRGVANPNLHPRDYLNASAHDPAPFSFCPIHGPGDDIAKHYGSHNLHKSRLHLGSSARVQRVLQKALRGLPVTISVLGGSISACHGAGDDPLSTTCYPAQFFSWWNEVFPHPASELTNGARRRTDSSYFSYCNAHHLPDHTDLVILEFDSDDQYDDEWLMHFELLVRSILLRPDQPAVLILGHFAPQIQGIHGFAGPDTLHTLVGQFYDVPHISSKGILYHDYLHNPSLASERYYTDPILANAEGHQVLADVLIHYFQSQICEAWSLARGYSFGVPNALDGASDATVEESKGLFRGMGDIRKGETAGEEDTSSGKKGSTGASPAAVSAVPPFFLYTRPDDSGGSDPYRFSEVKPFCVSANDLINPLPASLFFGSGWHQQKPKDAISDSQTPVDAYYWWASYPMSKIRIPIAIEGGNVAVWYLKEKKGDPSSEISCWVDNNFAGAKTISAAGDGLTSTASIYMIDQYVSSGSHFVECQLQGSEGVAVAPFRLLGVFTS